jgi:putative FmdB family regulatory protein
MPIYEYRCRDCGRKSTFVTLSVKAAVEPKCPKCGGVRLEKLVSRVAVRRSAAGRVEGLADPARLGGLDENDPKSVARWMKTMGREMGDEMGEDLGEDFDEDIDRAIDEGPDEEGAEDGGDPDNKG